MFYLSGAPEEVTLIETESRMMASSGGDKGGNRELLTRGMEFQAFKMKTVWRSDSHKVSMLNTTELYKEN